MTEQPIPLTEATFLILLSLNDRPQHGYAIMKKVAEISGNRVVFSTGTLYGALKRLLEQGWIERLDLLSNEKMENERVRKAYRLTEQGRGIFKTEIQRMQQLVKLSLESQGKLS